MSACLCVCLFVCLSVVVWEHFVAGYLQFSLFSFQTFSIFFHLCERAHFIINILRDDMWPRNHNARTSHTCTMMVDGGQWHKAKMARDAQINENAPQINAAHYDKLESQIQSRFNQNGNEAKQALCPFDRLVCAQTFRTPPAAEALKTI